MLHSAALQHRTIQALLLSKNYRSLEPLSNTRCSDSTESVSALNLPGVGKAPTDHHHHRCAPQPLRTKARFLDASDVCYIAWETETKFWSWVEKDPEVRRVRVRWIMKTLHAETKRALKTTTPFDQNGQSLDCWSLWEERNRISRFTGVNKQ